MNIEIDYVSKPFWKKDIQIEGYIMSLNWNIFRDKKDDNKLIMRVRYVLSKDGVRQSLKVMTFIKPIEFHQIYIDDVIKTEIELSINESNIESFINKYFGEWLNSDFIDMLPLSFIKKQKI
jgi:sulfatase maturation enzyme AslB (radical SAM superfamily)